MEYNTVDFNDILKEIEEQIGRIDNEVDIHKFSLEENVYTYNRLATILLKLKEIE